MTQNISSDRFIPQRTGDEETLFSTEIVDETPYKTELFKKVVAYEPKSPILQYTTHSKKIVNRLERFKEINMIESLVDKPRKIPDITQQFEAMKINCYPSSQSIAGKKGYFAVLLPNGNYVYDLERKKVVADDKIDQPRTCIALPQNCDEYIYSDIVGGKSQVKRIDLIKRQCVGFRDIIFDSTVVLEPYNKNVIILGTMRGKIDLWDFRLNSKEFCIPNAHNEKICGLAAEEFLLASGDDDGSIKIWDIRKQSKQITEFKFFDWKSIHALTWHNGYLLSGGARGFPSSIKLFDINQNKNLDYVNPQAKVSHIHFSDNGSNEFVSTHWAGYEENLRNIILWKLSKDNKIIPLATTTTSKICTLFSTVVDVHSIPTLVSSNDVSNTIDIRSRIFEPKMFLPTDEPFEEDIR